MLGKYKKTILYTFIGISVLCFILYEVFHSTILSYTEAEIQKVKKSGWPTTFSSLTSSYPKVSPKNDAIKFSEKVEKLHGRSYEFTDEQAGYKAVVQYVKSARLSLDFIHNNIYKHPYAIHYKDPESVLSSESIFIHNGLFDWLIAELMLNIHLKDHKGILKTTRALFHLSEIEKRAPSLLGQLTWGRRTEKCLSLLGYIINGGCCNEEILSILEVCLQQKLQGVDLKLAFIGEFVILSENRLQMQEILKENPMSWDKLQAVLDFEIYIFLKTLRKIAKAMDMSGKKRFLEISRIEKQVGNLYFSSKAKGIALVAWKIIENLADIYNMQVAVAVEKYKLKHKRAPQNLNELVPGYINEIPMDPLSDNPIRYKKQTSESYIVYSVGPNGNDDGGKGDDCVFNYEDFPLERTN